MHPATRAPATRRGAATRELVYYVAVSLDGQIASADGDYVAFSTEGDHIAMIIRDWSDTIPEFVRSALALPPAAGNRFDTVVMGWDTYAAGLPHGGDSPFPHLRQMLVTTRDPSVPDDLEIVDHDPAARIAELKTQPGRDIWLSGGGKLAGALVDQIDRLVLKVNPVVLGPGVPLFAGAVDQTRFDLQTSTRYDSGVVINDYRRA